jgi:hypothetical protein
MNRHSKIEEYIYVSVYYFLNTLTVWHQSYSDSLGRDRVKTRHIPRLGLQDSGLILHSVKES